MTAGRVSETSVARDQRRVERFGKSHIDDVMGGEIVPQFPDPRQKEIVRIPAQGKIGQVGERRAATLPIDLARRRIPADNLRDFDVEQMGRVQRLSRVEQSPA